MKTLQIFYLLIFFTLTSNAQNRKEIPEALIHNYKIKPGDKPNLNINKWILNIPNDKTLKNKFILLTYWDGGNVSQAALNHLEKVYNNFKDRSDFLLLAYSNKDSLSVLNEFKKANINTKAIVACNTKRVDKLWSNGVDSIYTPMALLIDDEGYIIWVTIPTTITEEDIKKFLDKKLELGTFWR
ncbi:hypothetical protein FEDK69T_30430 [Flavobacterium enshiense DK69]|uniref:Thioredoxin domain-containing protein n=1 Tax=Flavobacterium enshiense DK69 TaxID=1107311 RepID=V6S744_9FLAO|nr:hypothetical protein [Flavobacterium enshiense]ESU20190.1 hypothetical protein FEDK69T_30430 [Flavobacterium enshiense DK69]KGO92612.1 hypothetical protein Q767_15565 [Flavobacterium enshiense DK69]